jgi:hypothetical protein
VNAAISLQQVEEARMIQVGDSRLREPAGSSQEAVLSQPIHHPISRASMQPVDRELDTTDASPYLLSDSEVLKIVRTDLVA